MHNKTTLKKKKSHALTDFTLTIVHLKTNSKCHKVSPFSVIKTYLTVIARTWLPYCPLSFLLLQSDREFIPHHCFLQLPINTASHQRKRTMKQEYPTHGVLQYLHCCACSLHLHSSVHFLGGKSLCLGYKFVTAQGINQEYTVSWQLCLRR